MIAQVRKISRPKARPLWPAWLHWPAWLKKIHPSEARSLLPFVIPMGLTILPSLEAARLYPWWVATLVFNAVWITLRLWDDRVCKKGCGIIRRVLMAMGIVILADTMVLATNIDICSADHPGCLLVFFQKPVRYAVGFVPKSTAGQVMTVPPASPQRLRPSQTLPSPVSADDQSPVEPAVDPDDDN